MKRLLALLFGAALLAVQAPAQVRHEMRVPDIPGYLTLKGDMHIHTVFSDGTVWPTTRVQECVWEGLDLLCITDHVDGRLQKYTNNGTFSKERVDRNTAYELAAKAAKETGVLIVHGCEITSQIMPPGHFNALFTSDNNPIGKAMDAAGSDNQPKGADDAIRTAKSQGAFMTWNHPHWCRQAPNKTVIYEEHEKYCKEGLLNGVEIYNWWEGYSPEAHHWAVEKGLTLISGTDSHAPMFMDIDFMAGELRPVTLIFAKERSLESIREALDDHRTAVFADGKVYGAGELIRPLLESCLKIERIVKTRTKLSIEIFNDSSIPVTLDKAPGSEEWQMTRHLTIHPFEHYTILVYRLDKNQPIEADAADLNYTVDNFFTDAGVRLPWRLHIDLK